MYLSYLQENKANSELFARSTVEQLNTQSEFYDIEQIKNTIIRGDCLRELKKFPDECIDTIMTSTPYWALRDYGVEGQLGKEKTLDEYLKKLLEITAELKRVLKPTGVMFWNHGDCYSSKTKGDNRKPEEFTGQVGALKSGYQSAGGSFKVDSNIPTKSLCLQNYRLVIRMIDEQGWILRNTIIWDKPNHTPASVRDRFTNSYEPLFMLVKRKKYWFDLCAVKVPQIEDPLKGKNPGDVWQIHLQPFHGPHPATYPKELCKKPILSSCPRWICKKCGKARTRIVKTETGKKKERGSNYEATGWTDCGCDAGWDAGIVLDPFAGTCTTGVVAKKLKRNWIMIELNKKYCEIGRQRLTSTPNPLL